TGRTMSRAPQPRQVRKPPGSGEAVMGAWQRGHCIAGKEYRVEAMTLQRPLDARVARQIFGRHDSHVLALLRAAWPQAVGAELGRRTEVVALEGRTLRVRVPDAGWRKALHRVRVDILGRLHDVAGSLAPRQLGFMEGPVGGATAAPPSPTPKAAVPT